MTGSVKRQSGNGKSTGIKAQPKASAAKKRPSAKADKKKERCTSKHKEKSVHQKSTRHKKDHGRKSKPGSDNDKKKRSRKRKKEERIKRHPKEVAATAVSGAFNGVKKPEPPKEKLRFDGDKKLMSGTKISMAASGNEVVVLKLLGSGGFGDVYLVEDNKQNRYAMKTEFERAGNASRMKMEVKAYLKIATMKKENAENGTRLLGFFGSGSIENLKFFIMSLVGPSIESLVVKYEICFGTALRLAMECFDGIVDLHQCGFIHRDIKPENYSIGLNAERRRVYLVDLGMVCRTIEDPKEMPATSKYGFIGTMLYAPRTSHLGNVQTRKDDLESWLYSCIDIFAPNKLPWAKEDDRHKVCGLKEEFFKNPPQEIMQELPARFDEILKKINSYAVLEIPDYKTIRDMLDQTAKDEEIDFNEPFEWELGEPPKRKDEPVKREEPGKREEPSNKQDDMTQLTAEKIKEEPGKDKEGGEKKAEGTAV